MNLLTDDLKARLEDKRQNIHVKKRGTNDSCCLTQNPIGEYQFNNSSSSHSNACNRLNDNRTISVGKF